jgi:hypothetical protein
MTLPVTFATLTQGNQPLSLLDEQFAAIGEFTVIPCTASGPANSVTLTPTASGPPVTSYNSLSPLFVWTQNTTTTGLATIAISGLPALSAYKNNGAIAIGSGDLVAGLTYQAVYNPLLNSGAGGFVVNFFTLSAVLTDLNITSSPLLSISPTGSPTGGSLLTTYTSLNVQAATGNPSNREFLVSIGLTSSLGNGLSNDNGDKSGLYVGAVGQAGTGNLWAGSFLVDQAASSGTYIAQGIEIQVNNFNADRGGTNGLVGLPATPAFGLSVAGTSDANNYTNTAGIDVSSFGGVSSNQPLWSRGLQFLGYYKFASIADYSTAPIGHQLWGSYTYGIDGSHGAFGGAVLLAPNNVPAVAQLTSTSSVADLVHLDGTNTLNIGAGGVSAVQVTPASLFSSTVGVLGGTSLAALAVSGAATFTSYVNATGNPSLSVSPTGNPTGGSLLTTYVTENVQATTGSATNREFLVSIGLISNLGSGAANNNNDKVALYTGAVGNSGTGDLWAFNPVLVQSAASGSYNAQCIEVDINNLNASRGAPDNASGMAGPVANGITISGANDGHHYTNTAGLSVVSQGSGGTSLFTRGVVTSGYYTYTAFADYSAAPISYEMWGSYTTGLDASKGTFSGQVLLAPNNVPIISALNTAVAVSELVKMDNSNNLKLGAGAATCLINPLPQSGSICAILNSHATAGDVCLTVGSGVHGADSTSVLINFTDGGNNTIYGNIARSGSTTATTVIGTSGGITYNTASDIRGKPNRELLSAKTAHDAIMQLRIWDFDKDGNALRGVGVIAQEAQAVHWSFAHKPPDPDQWWSAEKSAPVPFLIRNVQDLNDKIEKLERVIEFLLSRAELPLPE